jgi:hypothetical protein
VPCAVWYDGADPAAKVTVTTRNGAGKLVAKMNVPLGGYTDAPVRVRLEDGDSAPIVEAVLGAIPPKGRAPFKQWQFKSKALGLQKLILKNKGVPGELQLTVKAKKWFSAAAADQDAASTRLTVTVGGQCFTHVATKKND